jgi:BNR repeat-like domain
MRPAVPTVLACALALAGCGGGSGSGSGGAHTVKVSGATPFTTGCDDIAQAGALYPGAEVEPFVAANPLNPDNLIGVWQQDRWSTGGARGVMTAASFDGGRTWTSAQVPFSRCTGGSPANGGDYPRATDPWISIGVDGVAYFMALSFYPDPSAMLVSRSTDGGLTWEAPQTLVLSTDPDLFHDKNSITADPVAPGHAYAIWDRYDYVTDMAPILFSRTTDAGVSWEATRIIYDPGMGYGTIGSRIAVLPDGTLVNLFTESSRDTGRGWLRVIRSTDQGLNWSAPVTVAEILMVGNYDAPTDTFVRSGGFLGALAAGPTGVLHAAWQDARFSLGQVDGIALATSIDGGLTWTEPVQVNGEPLGDAFTPSLAVAADGTVGVSYYDWRYNDGAADIDTAYWLATSADGITWTERRIGGIFDIGGAARAGCCVFLGDYQGLVAGDDAFGAFFARATGGGTLATDRSDVRYAALSVPDMLAKRAWVPQAAGRFEVTPQWRARVAAQLEHTRKSQPDREAPPYLRRR